LVVVEKLDFAGIFRLLNSAAENPDAGLVFAKPSNHIIANCSSTSCLPRETKKSPEWGGVTALFESNF